MNTYIGVLLSLPLFSGFTKESLPSALALCGCRVSRCEKGQVIHLQGETCRAMDIVLEGAVSVQKIDASGNVLKVSVFSGGGILGANLLFASRNAYPMTVVADTKAAVLHMDKDLVLILSQSNAPFLLGLMKAVSDRTLVLTDKIDAISLKTIRERILDYLRYEYSLQKTNVLRLPFTKKELAERFGIQRTSLSREFQKMRLGGLLDYDAGTVTLKSGILSGGDGREPGNDHLFLID
ncbi:MAG: Crp/Fnr family transcriptional regulator [Christensenellales bacterium]